MTTGQQPTSLVQSSFVTTVAWIFIVLGGFATLIAILQYIMVHTVFPVDQMRKALDAAKGQQQIPHAFAFMFGHIKWFVVVFLVLSVTTLVSSIGLLRRKNWGRVVFIALMAFGIVCSIGSLVLQYFMIGAMTEIQPAAAESVFRSIANVMCL